MAWTRFLSKMSAARGTDENASLATRIRLLLRCMSPQMAHRDQMHRHATSVAKGAERKSAGRR